MSELLNKVLFVFTQLSHGYSANHIVNFSKQVSIVSVYIRQLLNFLNIKMEINTSRIIMFTVTCINVTLISDVTKYCHGLVSLTVTN